MVREYDGIVRHLLRVMRGIAQPGLGVGVVAIGVGRRVPAGHHAVDVERIPRDLPVVIAEASAWMGSDAEEERIVGRWRVRQGVGQKARVAWYQRVRRELQEDHNRTVVPRHCGLKAFGPVYPGRLAGESFQGRRGGMGPAQARFGEYGSDGMSLWSKAGKEANPDDGAPKPHAKPPSGRRLARQSAQALVGEEPMRSKPARSCFPHPPRPRMISSTAPRRKRRVSRR